MQIIAILFFTLLNTVLLILTMLILAPLVAAKIAENKSNAD